jgi:3D (Asp-Asp-Asp) domain-containing protein
MHYNKVNELNNEMNYLMKENSELIYNNSRQSNFIEKAFGTTIKNKPIYSTKVTATAYSARKEECDANPEITASGNPSRVGVIAISKDLETDFGLSFKDMVLIENYGLFKIDDRMNSRWKRRIDILHGNPEAARLFGKKEVTLTWIGKGE